MLSRSQTHLYPVVADIIKTLYLLLDESVGFSFINDRSCNVASLLQSVEESDPRALASDFVDSIVSLKAVVCFVAVLDSLSFLSCASLLRI